MASSAIYPGTIPTMDFATIRYTRAPGTIQSPMEGGPTKIRRRWTGVPRQYPQTLRFTETDFITFDDFFYNTLAEGSLSFDHPDPMGGVPIETRFTSEPTWRLLAHKAAEDGRVWEGQVFYEVLG